MTSEIRTCSECGRLYKYWKGRSLKHCSPECLSAFKAKTNARIKELAATGFTMKEIAVATEMSYTYVQKLCKAEGIKAVKKYNISKPKSDKVTKVIELRRQGLTYNEIEDTIGISKGYAGQICRKENLGGAVRQGGVSVDPADYVKRYHPECEYVDGWTDCESYLRIKILECGHVINKSAKTIRQKSRLICPECKEVEEQIKKQHEEIARLQKVALDLEKKRKFWSREMEQETLKTCPVCRGIFFGKRKYCSEGCRQKIANARNSDRRARLIKASMRDGDITLEGLYNKYDGVCYICGGKCDWKDCEIVNGYFIAGNNYPSIDHYIPLSKGGLHSWENVKLACRRCNSIKRDKVM